MIVVDTSGVFAALDADASHHAAARAAIEDDSGPLLLSPFVLAELDYMILNRLGERSEVDFLQEVSRSAYELVPFDEDDLFQAIALVERYGDLKIGLADASIAVIAGRMRTTRLLTLDERHFRAMRPIWGDAFTLLPKDSEISSS